MPHYHWPYPPPPQQPFQDPYYNHHHHHQELYAPQTYTQQATAAAATPLPPSYEESMALFIQTLLPGIDTQSVTAILKATSLSISTVLIGIIYTKRRYPYNVRLVNLVVGFALANKFNDDNTFTNRSWSTASGVAVEELNREEKQWLEDIKWGLSVVNFEAEILALEQFWETWIQRNCYFVY
ncbi:CLG1 [Candida theae]|uniref:CLG1 n=1 Tax=Candida theae TaxID=1198502 RepID=A0AAD5BFB4_9ASCO|nr:CLG1 [Candida theae]KAI5958890.1 CLG1 [Candida theae]